MNITRELRFHLHKINNTWRLLCVDVFFILQPSCSWHDKLDYFLVQAYYTIFFMIMPMSERVIIRPRRDVATAVISILQTDNSDEVSARVDEEDKDFIAKDFAENIYFTVIVDNIFVNM